MNKEQEQIIDEVYQNYLTNFIPPTCPPNLDVQPSYYEPMTKEWFIKSIKERGLRGEEFSNKWGLKIEERELSLEERWCLLKVSTKGSTIPWDRMVYPPHEWMDNVRTIDSYDKNFNLIKGNDIYIPRKLITLTYKENKIESYE